MAKYLTDRHEIAKAMNFGKHPVLHLNMENHKGFDGPFAEGCRVRLAWDDPRPKYAGMSERCYLYHSSEGKIGFLSGGFGISADFGYRDVMEMTVWANAPVVHMGDTVVVVQDWPSQRVCKVRLMRMPDRFNKFCQVACYLEDIEEDAE